MSLIFKNLFVKMKLLLIIILLLVSGCISQEINTVDIISGNSTYVINVEMADEPQEWSRGLMFRSSLEKDSGMLFVFDDSSERRFWMKNTLIPLDIIFISNDMTIVNIEYAVPCKNDPCITYKSNGDAKYVLEVNGNYTQKHGVKKGDDVYFNR
jgi:uncharacterized membrane protein (UPF0127 family)